MQVYFSKNEGNKRIFMANLTSPYKIKDIIMHKSQKITFNISIILIMFLEVFE